MATDASCPVPPGLAEATRQAAALYLHWRRGDDDNTDGEMAVLEELTTAEQWSALVCALLAVGCNMADAARDGEDDAYLAFVQREAMLAEVSGA
jgi:hypothetical protein